MAEETKGKRMTLWCVAKKSVEKDSKTYYILTVGTTKDANGIHGICTAFVTEEVFNKVNAFADFDCMAYVFYKDNKALIYSVL